MGMVALPRVIFQKSTASFRRVIVTFISLTKNCLGFKSEWATVKDQSLYVGGLGKAWTTPTGELVNYHPQYIKKVTTTGEVSHIDWHTRYEALAKAVDISFPGILSTLLSILKCIYTRIDIHQIFDCFHFTKAT
jgi:hypothetical protein